MEWLIALGVMAAGLILLPWWLATRSDAGRKGGGAADFLSGLAQQHDPTAAMIAEENEKRLAMEGEQDAGGPKDAPEDERPA